MFKCSCRRMKCDEGSDAWNNLRISHIRVFLKNLGQHVPRKKNMEFAKVRRKNFFLAKMAFSRSKNLEQPSYIYIHCLLGGYVLPTTFYGNQKQPLNKDFQICQGRFFMSQKTMGHVAPVLGLPEGFWFFGLSGSTRDVTLSPKLVV